MSNPETPAHPLSILSYVILELLERRPLSGYDVKKRFLSSLAFGWHAHASQLYATLRQLEQGGYVTSQTAPSRQGPARRIYTIMPAGHAALVEWLQSPLDITQQKNELLLRVWAADLMPGEGFGELLAEIERQTRDHLSNLIALRDKWQQRYGPPETAADARVVGSLLCFEHDIQAMRSKLVWLERAATVIHARSAIARRPTEAPPSQADDLYME